jgi:hypothetical protein
VEQFGGEEGLNWNFHEGEKNEKEIYRKDILPEWLWYWIYDNL